MTAYEFKIDYGYEPTPWQLFCKTLQRRAMVAGIAAVFALAWLLPNAHAQTVEQQLQRMQQEQRRQYQQQQMQDAQSRLQRDMDRQQDQMQRQLDNTPRPQMNRWGFY